METPPPTPSPEPQPRQLTATDLSIVKIEPPVCNNDDCAEVATHYIEIDVRGAGFATQLAGPFCLHCAHLELDKLRLCFPAPPPVPKDDCPF